MWEARCYQDIGDQENLHRALGIYDELLLQPDASEPFRVLKAKVLRLAMEAWCNPLQKKYEAASQRGEEWLKKARPDQERAPEGLAIRYFAALALHQQVLAEKAKKDGDAEVARRLASRIPKMAKYVSDNSGEYQKAAKDLLSKYRDVGGEPTNFVEARDAGKTQLDSAQVLQFNLKQEEAKGKAKDAKVVAKLKEDIAHANLEAIRLLRLAIVLRDKDTSIDDINVVRYFLAYLYYTNGRYLDAAVMGEFLARHYPSSTGARHGAKIAMAGYLQAYNSVLTDEKEFETRQMVRVASYVAAQWPNEPDADEAWMILGDLAIREQDLEKAAEYLNHIPKNSPRRADADLKAGQALWGTYLNGQAKDPKPPAEVAKKLLAQAEEKLKAGVVAMRKQAGKDKPVTYNLLAAELSLAQLYVNTGRGEDAIQVLDGENGPLKLLAKKDPVTQTKENFPRETYKAALRAFVAVQDMDNAEKMMKAMEALVQGQPDAQKSLTQIYISLGREVEQQVDTTTDPAKLNKLLNGFELFLDRIANSKQATFNSLSWVGVTFYNLGSGLDKPGRAASTNAKKYYESAAKTYERLLTHPDLKPEMKPGLEVRLSKCKRRTGDYKGAVNMLLKLLATNNKALEAQREACYTFQEWAASAKKPYYYDLAMLGYRDSKTKQQLVWGWNGLANKVQSNPAYRDTMHEARYNMLECRFKQAMEGKQGKDRTDALKHAITSLSFTYRSFPKMGGQEWWEKYDQLLKNVQRALDPNKPALGLKAFMKEEGSPKTASS